jgi:hypothetical protein
MRMTVALALTSMLTISSSAFAQNTQAPGMNGNGLDSTGSMPARSTDVPTLGAPKEGRTSAPDNSGRPGDAHNGPGDANTRNNGG